MALIPVIGQLGSPCIRAGVKFFGTAAPHRAAAEQLWHRCV